MDTVTQIQIQYKAVCISLYANIFGKGINISLLHPLYNYGQTVEQTGLFSPSMVTSVSEGKL